MFGTALRLLSIGCCVLVGLGWALFAIDETREASAESTEMIAGADAATHSNPSPDQERAREQAHSTAREAIDDVNDVLLAPFAGLTDSSDNKWVRRTVPALLALLVYGFGLAYLARFMSGRA